jgi:uncharacterized protein (DUF1778 family)
MPTKTKADARLSIRASEDQKAILSEAARAKHLNTSQFVLQASLDAAAAVLTEQTVFILTPEQWEEFQRRLDEPARVIPALQKLHVEMTHG